MPERIPVIVISGFLGSGKTTLVRRLLDDALEAGLRLAVISNEFGELGIDAALLSEGSAAYVELAGGCVCCQLSSELVDTLEMLRARAHPHRIVIETSGVALPYDTLLNLWREPVSDWITDDLAAVVVNAEQVLEGRDLDGTFADQVSSADLLILNKIDLVAPEKLVLVEQTLRDLEPDAPLVRCAFGQIDCDLLFPPDPGAIRKRNPRGSILLHQHEDFVAREIYLAAPIRQDELIERVRSEKAIRAKGFVLTPDGPVLVQGVGSRIEVTPAPEPPSGLLGRIVLIERQ